MAPRLVVGGDADGSVRIHRTNSGELLATVTGAHTSAVYCAAFFRARGGPRAATLVTGSSDATLALWDISEEFDPESGVGVRAALRTVLTGHGGPVWGVACDGLTIVSASADGSLKVWAAASGECLATLRGHAGGARCVTIHPSGHSALSGSQECVRFLPPSIAFFRRR